MVLLLFIYTVKQELSSKIIFLTFFVGYSQQYRCQQEIH